jgi:hypothetical protein
MVPAEERPQTESQPMVTSTKSPVAPPDEQHAGAMVTRARHVVARRTEQNASVHVTPPEQGVVSGSHPFGGFARIGYES